MRGKYKKVMEVLLVFLRPSPRPFVGQKGGGGVLLVGGTTMTEVQTRPAGIDRTENKKNREQKRVLIPGFQLNLDPLLTQYLLFFTSSFDQGKK